jgi:putative ABC transport system permease protein
VVGIAAPRHPLERQAAVFVTDGEARRLSGHPGRADALGVFPAPGTSTRALAAALRRVAPAGVVVSTGGERGAPEFIDAADALEGLTAVSGMFGGLALIIAMFVIAATLGLAIQLREREIALLRAIAATPRQVRRMLRWEAIVLALFASAAGYLPGVALAHTLIDAFAARGLAPEGMAVDGGAVPALVTVIATVSAALLAAWAGARRAARVAPTRALQESAVEPRMIGAVRLLAGLVALAGAAATLSIALGSRNQGTALAASDDVALVLVAAIALLGPLVARLAAFVPGRLVARLSPVGGFLATAATRSAPRRVASAMTPLVLAVAMGGTLLFSGTTQDAETARQSRDRQIADLVVSATAGVPEAAVREIRATPGVSAATGISPTGIVPLDDARLGSGYVSLAAQAIDAEGAARTLDLGVRSGSLSDLRGHAIAVGSRRARAGHVHVGDHVAVALGDGTRARLRVAATYDRSLGFGEFVLPRGLAARHSTQPLADAVLVRTAPGVSRSRVERALRAVAAAQPGLHVGGRTALKSGEARERRMLVWLNRVLAGLIFAFTAIAAVNTLAMIALSRGRELALLRLVGATPRQVARMARWEAGLVVFVGVGLGAAVAAAALVPFSRALTGSSMPDLDPLEVVILLGGTAALGLVASLLPTRLALRASPADAIGAKE